MELTDPSASECLRLLLEEQSRSLRVVVQRLNALCRASWQASQATEWSGPARYAHDLAIQRILANLTIASVSVDNAADCSVRAAGTLGSRVG